MIRDSKGRFVKGNGSSYTTEDRLKLSLARRSIDQRGINNKNWKGDNISYTGLHKWVRENLPQPELCEMCKEQPPYDLANITGDYTRDFNNWQYLCRRCHLRSDNRIIKNLIQFSSTHEERVLAAHKQWETKRKNER